MTSAFSDRLQHAPDGSLYVVAPAKINLFLHITGRRDDGYHVLESLFAFTGRGDLLRFREADAFSLSITGQRAVGLEGECNAEDNLVSKVARALSEKAGAPCNVSVELEKNLPVASGLGGGSSDAAAALIGLNHICNFGMDEEALSDLALSIGADVPACLPAAPQLVRGIGEQLSRVSLGWSAGIVVVNPGKHVSTPEVFNAFRRFREGRGLPPFDVALSNPKEILSNISMLDVMTSNSLQDPAVQLCPTIMEVERFLRINSQQELLRMSGSGASMFALYHDRAAAEAVARRVRDHAPDWWVMADEIGM